MQLIVLGMHRSGTSVLARVLNLMGAYFGPEGISTGANAENPKGFWERRDVRTLNDSVLHGVGCDWDRVLQLDLDTLPPALREDFDKRAARLVLEMDAHRPWLLKEPRLCLLLPLWRKWLEVPVCIHVFRNPVEVASSLHVRNNIPVEAGIALWERYVRAALLGSAGLPQVVVSHQRLMQTPVAAVAQLFDSLARHGVQGLRMPSEHEVLAFVRDELYRERQSRDDLRAYAGAPQLALFEALEAGGQPSGTLHEEVGDMAALVEYEAGLPPLATREVKVPETTETVLRRELALREQEIRFVREMSSKYEADVRQRDERLSSVERDHKGAREAIVRLQDRLAQQTRDFETVMGAKAELDDRNVALQARLQIAEDALAKAEQDVSAASGQLERHRQARSNAERNAEIRLRDTSRLTRLLMQRDGQIAELVEENRRLAGMVESAKEGAKRLGEAAKAALQVAETEVTELRRQLTELQRSRTWRLGAPVRAAARFVKHRLGRAPLNDVELLRTSEWFDADWYLSRYPDVAQTGSDPAEHYFSFGGNEGRNPGPRFNTKRYLEINADVAQSGMNALVHYLKHGQEEGRKTC